MPCIGAIIICVATSLLLGLVYSITKEPIAESRAQDGRSQAGCFPAEEYVAEEYTGADEAIVGMERAISGGAQQVDCAGNRFRFRWAIDMAVGIDMDGWCAEYPLSI